MKMPIRRGYVDGPFGQVHYRFAGNGTPLILCHHGPSSSHMFEPAMELLAARDMMPIAIDMPGCGMSDRVTGTPSIGGYAQIIDPVRRYFDLDTISLLGIHTGGNVACEYAFQAPERVRSLVLGAPMVLSGPQIEERIAKPTGPVLMPPAVADGSHILSLWQRRMSYPIAEENVELVNFHFCKTIANWQTFFDGTNASLNYDIRPALSGLKVPTLILSGTLDNQFSYTENIKSLRPDFQYVAIEDASGYIIDEQTSAWVDSVTSFVL